MSDKMERIFKRKIYDQLLQWKQSWEGKTAILIEGARRVGKSTIVEQFAKNEYESYILIDFNRVSSRVKSLFDDLMDLDFFFFQLQATYNVALKRRKSVIIFDEATASLDYETESRVMNAIKDRGNTCILIAHRLSAIKYCDRIVMLDKGRILESGTHDELMAKHGRYYEMVNSEIIV